MADSSTADALHRNTLLTELQQVKHEMAGLKAQIAVVNQRLMRTIPRGSLQFQIHLTHHCNLDCYACQHFSTLSKEWYLDLDSLDRQLKRLAELLPDEIHGVNKIYLLGGEPLLHPDVVGAIECVRQYFTFPEIRLTTNAILLPMQNETFWEACHKNSITVEISPYPLSIDLDGIKIKANKHGVMLDGEGRYAFNDVERRKFRQGMKPLNRRGGLNPREIWMDCEQANCCIQLLDGKLYQCSTAAYVYLLNEYFNESFQITERDYVDIFAVQSADEIFAHLSRPIPFCRYCNHPKGMNFEWLRSKRHICEFADWESEADDFLKKGDYDAARRLANDLLQYGAPGHAAKWAYRILAESHDLQGNLPEAITAAQRWLDAEPTRALPRELLARLHRNNHELDNAERLALEYIEQHVERRGWAYRELCYVSALKGDYAQALEYGKNAMLAHPEHQEFKEYFQRLSSRNSCAQA